MPSHPRSKLRLTFTLAIVQLQNIKLPTKTAVSGTVKLSSSSVLIGCDSTNAAAMDTTKNPRTIFKLSSMYPNDEK